jgi:5-methylcytosine-specific restriction protein A
MPSGLLRPCSKCGTELVRRGRCIKCERRVNRDRNARRKSANQRLYDARWRKASKVFLAEHPLCQCRDCRESETVMAADVVDHFIPHRGDHRLFWDKSNWRALSKSCHDKATVMYDGGFGNPVQEKER